MKNILIGIVIGITSLIPGVSAGTIIYLSKDYNYINNLILHFKANLKYILLIILGIIISTISFSKIIEFLFLKFPNETLYFIIGLLLKNIKHSVKKQETYNILFFVLGIIIILLLKLYDVNYSYVIKSFPKITILFLLLFSFCGFIDGALTITPGISGSMVMMILGPYYLYKSYLANITSNFLFFIPLLFYFLGNGVGIFIGMKVSTYFISHHNVKFTSFILGMIIASVFILIPPYFSFTCLILLVLGYILKE